MSHERLFSPKEIEGLNVYQFANDFLQREVMRRKNQDAPVSVMIKKVMEALDVDQMAHISYADLRMLFCTWERSTPKPRTSLTGAIVFTEKSCPEAVSLKARTYLISSDNKAFIPGSNDTTIFGICAEGGCGATRLDLMIANEQGGQDGLEVEYCVFLGRNQK